MAEDAADFLPASLSGLVKSHGPVYFMGLADDDFSSADEVLVHVDLLSPFADLSVSSKDELASKIQSGAFAGFPGASRFLDCARLVVLTLRVPRVTTMLRWQQRSEQQGETTIRPLVTQIYSDTSSEAAYAAVYDAWDQYVAELPHAVCWNIYESADGSSYSFVLADGP